MDTLLPKPVAFRYPLPSDEDLPGLSRLAFSVSETECGPCRDYHVTWPYLRSIGANGSGPESGWETQRRALLQAVAGRRSVRWLIAGGADAGVLALARSVADAVPAAAHSVTVVDRCGTPLALCRAYAEATGFRVETVRSDLLAFEGVAAFDVILFHHVLMFFDAEGRRELLRMAARWLAPGGRAILAFNDNASGRGGPHPGRRAWQRRMMEAAIASGEVAPPEDAEAFLARFETRRQARPPGAKTDVWRTADHLAAIEMAGLAVIETVAVQGNESGIAGHDITPDPRLLAVCGLAAGGRISAAEADQQQ